MLTLTLSLLAPAQAAEVQVASMVPINILVDGVPVTWNEAAQLGVSPWLPAGTHTVEARNLLGKTMAFTEVQLAEHQQARFEYRRKQLYAIGVYDLPSRPALVTTTTAPLAIPPDELATLPAHGGIAIHDGTQTVAVGMDVGALGGGVTVSDGTQTVSVGVNVGGLGGNVVITDTTSNTTVVTQSHGVDFGGMNGGVFIAEDPSTPSVQMDPRGYVGAEVSPRYSLPVMPEPAFGSFLTAMDKASFADDKHALLRTAVAHNALTCAQLARVLDTYSFGDDQVMAVRIARPVVQDPQNAFVLNDRFSFSSDAEKVQQLFR